MMQCIMDASETALIYTWSSEKIPFVNLRNTFGVDYTPVAILFLLHSFVIHYSS